MKRSGWIVAMALVCGGAWAQDDAVRRSGESPLDRMYAQAYFEPVYIAVHASYGVAQEVRLVKEAAEVERLSVENVSGSVTVIGWDEQTIAVEGTLGEDVEELMFDVSGSSALVEVKVPRHRAKRIKSDLVIHVPRRADVQIDTVSASIDVDGVVGDEIDAHAVSGSIRIVRSGGEISAETTSGSITIEDAAREVEAETVSGAIDVGGVPTRVRADSVSGSITVSGVREEFEAESVSGAITVYAHDIEEVDIETVSGTIVLHGTAATDADLQFNTLSGGTHLVLDRPIYGEYRLKSFSGGIDADFGAGVSGAPRSMRSKQLEFTLGEGNAQVDVESFSGSIRIRVN